MAAVHRVRFPSQTSAMYIYNLPLQFILHICNQQPGYSFCTPQSEPGSRSLVQLVNDNGVVMVSVARVTMVATVKVGNGVFSQNSAVAQEIQEQ